jgi:hypothetical protein
MPKASPKEAREIRVGKHFILGSKKLGKGSFGSIYLGTHADTREEVAIKLVTSAPNEFGLLVTDTQLRS